MKAHRPMMHAINKTLKRRDIGLHTDKQLEATTVCRQSGNTEAEGSNKRLSGRGTRNNFCCTVIQEHPTLVKLSRVVTSLVGVLESLCIWSAFKIMDLLVKMVLVVETTHFQPETSLFFWCKCPVCVCWGSELLNYNLLVWLSHSLNDSPGDCPQDVWSDI